MTIEDIKKTAEQKMGKTIEAFKNELHKIRTGRAHPGLLDQVHVDYYGSSVPISQVASTRPPCSSTIPFTTASPSPSPPWLRPSDISD